MKDPRGGTHLPGGDRAISARREQQRHGGRQRMHAQRPYGVLVAVQNVLSVLHTTACLVIAEQVHTHSPMSENYTEKAIAERIAYGSSSKGGSSHAKIFESTPAVKQLLSPSAITADVTIPGFTSPINSTTIKDQAQWQCSATDQSRDVP